jgi:hypothetical protein
MIESLRQQLATSHYEQSEMGARLREATLSQRTMSEELERKGQALAAARRAAEEALAARREAERQAEQSRKVATLQTEKLHHAEAERAELRSLREGFTSLAERAAREKEHLEARLAQERTAALAATRGASAERERAERPDDPHVAFELGCTFRALGRDDDATRELAHALRVERGRMPPAARATLLLRLAQLALGRRDDREAARLAQESLALVPGESLALQVHGLASIGTGQLAAALEDFRALGQGPSLTSAYRSDVDQVIAALAGALQR